MSRPTVPGGSFNDAPIPTAQTLADYIETVGDALYADKDGTATALAGKVDVSTISATSVTPSGSSVARVLGDHVASIPRRRALTVAALGDSITAQNTGTGAYNNIGYVTWFQILTRQRFRFPTSNNFGVGGEVTAQMLARIGDVVAAAPDICFVLGGTNDLSTNAPIGTITSNLTQIYDALEKIGTTIFAIPILGRSSPVALDATRQARGNYVNEWIRRQAYVRKNFYVVDCGIVFDDPNAASWTERTGYNRDGIHASPIGAYAIGKRAADIANVVYPDWRYPALNQSDTYNAVENPYGNLLGGNGMFGGGTTVATGWTHAGTSLGGATATPSKVTLADGRPGQKVTISGTSTTAAGTNTSFWRSASPANIVAGDAIEGMAEVSIGPNQNIMAVQLELLTTEAGTNYYVRDGYSTSGFTIPPEGFSGVLRTPPRLITANPTQVSLFLQTWVLSPATGITVSADVIWSSASLRKV